MISEEFFESETVVLGIGRGRLSSEQAALVTPTDTVLKPNAVQPGLCQKRTRETSSDLRVDRFEEQFGH